VRLVADANVLLSAVLGDRARLVLQHPVVEQVFTAEPTFAEVQEYAAILAPKRHLPIDAVLLGVATLPVTVVERATYANSMSQARRLVGKRDADDIDILALALHMGAPLWSNDNDFEESGVEWFTTAELLKHLRISRSR
jgi:predicted nucleic acid-binding protein